MIDDPPVKKVKSDEELLADYDAQVRAQGGDPTAPPPGRAPNPAGSDVTQVQRTGRPGLGMGQFVGDVIQTAVQPIIHPIATAEGVIEAPIEAGAAARKYVRGEESGADALKAQLPVVGMLAFGPTEGLAERQAAKVVGRAAAKVVGATVAGAATGPMFYPDMPTVGAAVGALYGLLGSSARESARPKSAVRMYSEQTADAFKRTFSPASRTPEARAAATILRASAGEYAAQFEVTAHQLDAYRRAIDPLSEADKLAFIDAYEGGASQPTPEFEPMATAIHAVGDGLYHSLEALGEEHTPNYVKNWLPHLYENPEQAAEVFAERRRTLEGSGDFLKARSIPTFAEAISLGLKPLTLNPVDLMLHRMREVHKYLLAHTVFPELKEAGLVNYTAAGEIPADGDVPIDDRIATVYGPKTGAVTLPEGAMTPGEEDPRNLPISVRDSEGKLRRSLKRVSDETLDEEWRRLAELNSSEEALHASVRESGYREAYEELPDTERKGAKGQEDLPDADGQIDPDVLAGHNQIIRDYNRSQIVRAARAKAMDRIEAEMASRPSGAEFRVGTDLYRSGGSVPGMRLMKPSDVTVPGIRIMGKYSAPEPVARILNNYLSPGMRGPLLDLYRGVGNILNQAQLGFSAFHLGFTSIDAATSRTALGLEYIADGRPVEGLRRIVSAPLAPLSGIAQGTLGDFLNWKFGTDVELGIGAKIRSAYLHPETAPPEYTALANAVKEAGGRITMDSFYHNSAIERMVTSWRAGEFGKAAAYSLPALIEASAKPIMEHIVPLQKLQVFGELAQKVLGDLPQGATLAERRSALQLAWDSVDNRMGQLVYGNIFWNRTVKDMAMISVRSVGWNVGTIRELGGGIGDLAGAAKDVVTGREAKLTHRAAYVISLPMTVGIFNAVYQYLRTGHGPSELKDYFYPKTGEVDSDGNPQRVQPPSYMKDLFAYAHDPLGTIADKTAPLPEMLHEMLYKNQDFYGDKIRNPHDPLAVQIQQEANYVIKQIAPFSLRNMNEMTKRGDIGTATKLGSWFGMTPAPRRVVRSDAQNLMSEYLAEHSMSGATPEDAAARESRAQILAGLRGNSSINLDDAVTNALERHQLTGPDIERLLKRAGTTGLQERFKRLTLPQAIEVFKLSNPHEKEQFAEALLKKLETFQKHDAVPEPLPSGLDGSAGESGELPPPPTDDVQPGDSAGARPPVASAEPVSPPPAPATPAPAAGSGGELRVPANGGKKKRIDLASIRARIKKAIVG